MTLERLKTLVLARLDELTQNGAEISRDTPHIRDFMLRIPGFADAQLKIIGTIIPKRKRFHIFHNPPIGQDILNDTQGGAPVYLDTVSYEMPEDFQSAIRITRADGYNAQPYIDWSGDRTLDIAYMATGEYVVEYMAFYDAIDDGTRDDTVIDVPHEAVPALVTGVAAMCVQHENEVAYTQLFAESQGLLANLKPKARPAQLCIVNRLF